MSTQVDCSWDGYRGTSKADELKTKKKPMNQPPHEDGAYESSDWETDDDTEEPEFLSTVTKNKSGGAMNKALKGYEVGSQVMYRGGKGDVGPYTVSAVRSNDTYDLIDGPKGDSKNGVKQNRLV